MIYSLLPIWLFLSASLATEDTSVAGFALLGLFSLLGFVATAGIGIKAFNDTGNEHLIDSDEIFWNKAREGYIVLEKCGSFIPAVKFFGKYIVPERLEGVFNYTYQKDTELQEVMNKHLENRFKTQNNGYTIHATVKSITRS